MRLDEPRELSRALWTSARLSHSFERFVAAAGAASAELESETIGLAQASPARCLSLPLVHILAAYSSPPSTAATAASQPPKQPAESIWDARDCHGESA